jgi:hypothetical protein
LKFAFLFGDYRAADYDASDHLAITVQNFSTHRDDGDENGCRIEIQLVHEEMSSLAAAKVTTLKEPVWRADIFSTKTAARSKTACARRSNSGPPCSYARNQDSPSSTSTNATSPKTTGRRRPSTSPWRC